MTYFEKGYRRKISLSQRGNSLMMLIAISLVTFVLFAFIKVIWYFIYPDNKVAVSSFNKDVLSWFILPADFNKMITRPWTLITHMFVQVNIWKIFADMLWLWCFGYIMQDIAGTKKIIPVFIYGALAGAVAFVLAYNLMPGLKAQIPYAASLGASAGVMAVAISTTIIAPGYRIFPMLNGGIPLWGLTALYVIIDLATISYTDTANLMSHIAGALAGFLFIFFLRKGYDGSNWMNAFFEWVDNLFNPDKPKKGKSIKEELFYKSTSKPFKKTPNVTQQRIDDILDKINQKGYNFLTEEEKELLKRASKEDM